MRIVFNASCIPTNVSDSNVRKVDLSNEHISRITVRVGIYSTIITFPLWIYLIYPNIVMPSNLTELAAEFLILLPLMILMPFIHEFIHLISRPWQIFRNDTFLLIDYRKPILKMNMAVRPGGIITREGFIWMSLLPLLLLTVLPFFMAATSLWSMPTLFGILPCQNLALSSIDVVQAFIIWKEMRYREVLSSGREK